MLLSATANRVVLSGIACIRNDLAFAEMLTINALTTNLHAGRWRNKRQNFEIKNIRLEKNIEPEYILPIESSGGKHEKTTNLPALWR